MTDYKDDLTPRESFAVPEPLGFPGPLSRSHKTETRKGTFYGVSVGPGDPGLLNLAAVSTIMNSPVIAAPRTKGGDMLALSIAREGINRFLELSFGSRMAKSSDVSFWAAKTVLPLDFPMSKDPAVLETAHESAADQLKTFLDKGQDVALLNLGDVTLYSTCAYMAEILERDGYEVRLIAGVTSFCAASAALSDFLTEPEKPVFILPGSLDEAAADRLLNEPGTKILMKAKQTLPETVEKLKDLGLAPRTSVVVNCGLPGEQVFHSLEDYEWALRETPEQTLSYYTVILIKDR